MERWRIIRNDYILSHDDLSFNDHNVFQYFRNRQFCNIWNFDGTKLIGYMKPKQSHGAKMSDLMNKKLLDKLYENI